MISYEYGLWVKGCYTDTLRGQEFYTETIYTLFGIRVMGMSNYPISKIDETSEYFALTLTGEADGRIIMGGQTVWVGWDEDTGVVKRVERRKYSLVRAKCMAQLWKEIEMPFCVANDIDDFIKWYMTGGHVLVEKNIAEQIIPHLLEPSSCVCVTDMGFTGISLLSDSIFKKAPTKKKRMEIIKRDMYRCRICGRRPDNHVDIELNVHHIRPFGEGGVTHEDNLITLCDTCHKGLKPHYEWSLYGLLKDDNNRDIAATKRAKYLRAVACYRQIRKRDA